MSKVNPCWSELLPDLLAVIASRIVLMEDFVAFRGVCVSWRAAAHKSYFNRSMPKIPMLMLPEKEDSDDREFFSLSRGKICFKMALPEAKGKRYFESKGWLITIGCKGEMHLLHPFSRVQIELPSIWTIRGATDRVEEPQYFIGCAELSCSPFESSDYVVMVHGASFALDFWRPGNKAWTRINHRYSFTFISDIRFFNGLFYIFDFRGEIWTCDVLGYSPTPFTRLFTMIYHDSLVHSLRQTYLVQQSSDELLIINRNGYFILQSDDEATHFDMIRLDLSNGRWTKITSLGDRSVFVGLNASFSVDAKSFAGGGIIKPNCIYFTDDLKRAYYPFEHGRNKDVGIYHLEDGKIESLPLPDLGTYHLEDEKIESWLNLQPLGLISPPVWVTPYF